MNIGRFSIVFLLLLACGCGPRRPAPPERFAEIGSARMGEVIPESELVGRELVRRQTHFLTDRDTLEIFTTPLSRIVWRIDLVIPEFPDGADPLSGAKKFAADTFFLDFGTADELHLPFTRVGISRAYDRGPRGVRISFIDKELAQKFLAEDSLPETALARKERRARDDVLLLEAAVVAFQRETGKFPGTLDDLIRDPGLPGWHGPYIGAIPADPWGRRFVYRRTAASFELYSTGNDGSRVIR